MKTALLAATACAATVLAPAAAESAPIPRLVTDAAGTQRLEVDGRPFLMLAGELGNSAAATVAWTKPLYTKLAAMKLNTVLVPVSWELIEPAEGKWAFDLVTDLVREARRNRLRVVLLWFGSWKNGMSSYVPAWVKADAQRFPRAEVKGGRRVESLSPFADSSRDADARAFAALMAHVKKIDERQRTVIMVQVENEIAMIDESADRSAAAAARYRAPVPRELAEYLAAHRATLEPELGRAWRQAGERAAGSWEEMFGKGLATEEAFMAWHYARYVDAVTRAGKGAYPLPMFTNAALNRPGKQPGQYPTGGPLPHLFDLWKAGAPSLDLLAPDIDLPNFVDWCDRYTRPGNALLIPEARNDGDAGLLALYAMGRGAIAFSPFAVESMADAAGAALTRSYTMLSGLAPVLAAAAPAARAGVLLEKPQPTTKLTIGGNELTVSHDYTFEWASPARHDPTWPRGGGLVMAVGPDEYVVAGNGIIVTFGAANIERIDEGRYEAGKFVPIRRLNGDETHQGRQLRLPMGGFGLQRVKLYRLK